MIRIIAFFSVAISMCLAAGESVFDWRRSVPKSLKNVTRSAPQNTWQVCAEYPGHLEEARKTMTLWLAGKNFVKKYEIPSPEGQKIVLSLWQNGERKLLLQYRELRPECTEVKMGELK